MYRSRISVLSRQLAPAVKELLGCMDVWCDSRDEESSQNFVLWAGTVLQERCTTVFQANV